jgi:hypothetical protein
MDLSHRSAASPWDCGVAERRWFGTHVAAAVLLFLAGRAVSAALAKEGAVATTRVLDVNVTFESKPVEGASVVAIDGENHIRALTDRDGKAQLRISAEGKINGIVALDPQRGVGGRWSRARKPAVPLGDVVPVSLEPAKPHTFRVVDTDGKPARLVPLVVAGCRTWTSGWVPTSTFEAAQLHTDARGEAVARWLPRDLSQVEVEIFDDRWTIEEVDNAETEQGITLVKVRQLHAVEGRLSMPNDASPEGLLIAGLGSNLNSSVTIHEFSARVRRDGTFTLYLADSYGYWLGVRDSQWASDPWIGTSGAPGKRPPGPIQLVAYAAIPLTVRVTRGPNHEPVVGASLGIIGGEGSILWDQARLQSRLGLSGAVERLYTDRDGRAQFPVCKGTHTIWLEAGAWQEDQTVEITGTKPKSVEFHRPWAVNRTIPGRLLIQGRPYPSGPGTRVQAWNVSNPEVTADGIVEADGRFTVKIDAPDVYLLAFDPKNRLSAAVRVKEKDATANLELIPTGSLSGVVVNSAGKPLAGHAVEALPGQAPSSVEGILPTDKKGNALPDNMWKIITKGADFQMVQVVLQSAGCDMQGRFKIDLVPAQMRVRIVAGTPADARGKQFSLWPERFRVDATQDVYLEPGEARENVRLVQDVATPSTQTPEQQTPRAPLERRLKRTTEDARLEGLRVLVVLIGDTHKTFEEALERLFPQEQPGSPVVRYEWLDVTADEARTQAALLSRLGWERPQAGEVELIALEATGAKIAAQRIRVDGTAVSKRQAADFAKRHAPAAHDALALLTAAQLEARKTGRRLWVVDAEQGFCSPRCADLMRWINDQRALLAKDYVVLRINHYDDHCEDASLKFVIDNTSSSNLNPDMTGGTPWFAIAEPDLKVLVTSDGPLGNICLPSTIEEKRHLKKMITSTARHLTPAECDRLIESLPKPSP